MFARVNIGMFLFILMFFGLLIFAPHCRADDSNLIITEIDYHPNKVTNLPNTEADYEWFELFNPGDSDLNISGWAVKDNLTNRPLPDFTIKSHNYVVIVANKLAFLAAFPTSVAEIVEIIGGKIGNGLANSGDELNLFDQNQILVDKIVWEKDFGLGKSISRDNNDLLVSNSPPHPGYVPAPVQYSDCIRINEVLPAPNVDQVEFVELASNCDITIDLTNWQIDDIEGGSSPYSFPANTIINAQSYLIFSHEITKIYFNDDGDSVRLFDPNGELKDTTLYDKTTKGLAFAKFDNGWQWTNQPTPNFANLPSLVASETGGGPTDFSIADAKKVSEDQIVSITGTVSVPPDVLSSQYFYIQDSTGGIQIYNYNKDFTDINEGNIIQASGVITSSHNEKRLKTNSNQDIIVLNPVNQPVIPNPISNLPTTQDSTGTLVSITGVVTKNDGTSIYLKLNDDQIKIYIIDLTGIKKPKLKVGDTLEVTGILSYYDDYFRLLPRYQSDIQLLSSGLPNSGSSPLLAVFASMVVTLSYNVLRYKSSLRAKRSNLS